MRENRIGLVLIHIFFIIVCACMMIPFLSIISISLSNESDIINYGYSLFPKNIDLSGYQYLLENPSQLLTSYKVTAVSSVVGVLWYMMAAAMCAYAISRKSFKYGKGVNYILFFTMLFNGGLVPTYMLMTQYLKLTNTYLALIIPMLSNVWYIFILRTFFTQLPEALVEAATIDGATEIGVFFKIILPLSKPVLATVGLLQLLGYWNSWFPALLYITKEEMYPLQYLLQVMLRNMQELMNNMDKMPMINGEAAALPMESTRMAMCILAIGPMLFIFPFFQKYFTKGLTVGSVKG